MIEESGRIGRTGSVFFLFLNTADDAFSFFVKSETCFTKFDQQTKNDKYFKTSVQI